MKKIIIDCDNTFGVDGCDLDDGLAIIYALGTGRCEVAAITTTFGNNTLEVITPNTISFMKQIGMERIPVYPGHENDFRQNEAARFLSDCVNQYPGEVSVLALGSLTNLFHAFMLDNSFFEKIPEISFMGGVTEPLIIMGKQLNELNFACNSEASYNVLIHSRAVKIATGNICLDALFTKKRFDTMGESEKPFLRWLCGQGQYWFEREYEYFGHDGIYKWDVYAAAALLYPEMFNDNIISISPDPRSMETGNLMGGGNLRNINVPSLKDVGLYEDHVYESYSNFASMHHH